jgi:DNA sulfur modification protein DndD
MKLLTIKLLNFRQFYGPHTIDFATDAVKNVTLFHAENGVGKTTLLNSILWCFYGRAGVTEKFEKSDDILSYQAVSEKQMLAKVDVTFEHEGRTYTATRRHSASGGGRTEEKLLAYEIQNGNTEPLPAPEAFISSVVPMVMAHHFFFDGEHAESFASTGNFKEVAEAIRNMLGSTVADCAIDDLKYAAKQFGENLADLPGDDRIRQKSTELQNAQRSLEICRADKQREEENLVVYNAQIALIDQELLDTRSAKELQQRRRQLEDTLRSANASLTEADKDTVRWIGRQAINVIATRLSTETLHFIDDEKLRGKIPSPYNEELVMTLLTQEACLCGRPLEPGSECFRNIQNLLRKAGNAEVQSKVMRARGYLGELKVKRTGAPKDLTRAQKAYASAYQLSKTTEQQLNELSEKLSSIDFEEIAQKERARADFVSKSKAADRDIGQIILKISIYERSIENLTREQQKLALSSAKAMKLLNRKTLAERAADLLKGVLASHEEQAKAFISTEVNKILSATARRNYKFAFGPGFAFDLTYSSNGRTVPRSSGENQLLSLAFIAALIKFCRDRSLAKNDPLLLPGIVAPLVLDSPFGQLDSTYRVDTSSFIALMAEQVALFVSSSQGSPEVLEVLSPRVGKEYVLISENRGPRNGKPSEELILNGRRYETSLFGCEKDMTRIEVVQQ